MNINQQTAVRRLPLERSAVGQGGGGGGGGGGAGGGVNDGGWDRARGREWTALE